MPSWWSKGRYHTPCGHTEWTSQRGRSSSFWQWTRQASEGTPGHLKCSRIGMSGSFAKLLLQFRARRSKMCFPYAFQLLCCIRRHSGLEHENKPKALPWIVFPQFLPAFTLQKPIWQILPLVHYLQIRTNKVLSQLDIKQLTLFCNFIKHCVNSSNCTGRWQTCGYGKYIQPVKPSMYWQWRKACSLSAPTHIISIHHPYKSLPAFFFQQFFQLLRKLTMQTVPWWRRLALHTTFSLLLILPVRTPAWHFGALGIFHPMPDLSGLLPSPAAPLTWPCGIILYTLGAPLNLLLIWFCHFSPTAGLTQDQKVPVKSLSMLKHTLFVEKTSSLFSCMFYKWISKCNGIHQRELRETFALIMLLSKLVTSLRL